MDRSTWMEFIRNMGGQKEGEVLRALMVKMYPLLAYVDLAENTVSVMRFAGFNNDNKPLETTYDEFIRIGAEETPEGMQRQLFLETFRRENLKAAFKKGRTYVELEHQHLMGDGSIQWMRSRMMLMDDNGDINRVLAVSSNIEEEMIGRLREKRGISLINTLSEDYEAVFFAEPWLDRVTVISRRSAMGTLKSISENEKPDMMTMDEFADSISKGFVNRNEAERIRAALRKERLMEHFCLRDQAGREVLTGLYRTEDGNRYFQIKLMPVSPHPGVNSQGIVIGFKDSDDVIREQKSYEQRLEDQVASQNFLLRKNLEKNSRMQNGIIESMATLVESRDIHTGDHVRNTCALVTLLVERLREKGLFPELEDETYAGNIVVGSELHDIGKIFISDVILNKRGKLTSEEFAAMQLHTTLGKEIVEEIFADTIEKETTQVILDIVYSHHERWDGTGYPQGLKGEEIPLAARIMAVADVLDALVSSRSYKEAFPLEASLAIIKNEAGTHFDSRIVDTLLEMEPEIRELLRSRKESSGLTSLSGAVDRIIESIQDRSVTGSFVEDYEAAVIVSPDTGKGRLLYVSDYFRKVFRGKFKVDNYYESIASMLGRKVNPEDTPEFLRVMSSAGMKSILAERNNYTLNYRAVSGNNENYHMQMRLIRIDYATGERNFDVLVGCKDIEAETQRRKKEEQQEEMARNVITGLSDDFEAIFYIELNNDSLQIVRAQERFTRHHPHLRDVATYSEFVSMAAMEVYEEDREGLIRHLKPNRVREILSGVEANYYDYRRSIHGNLQYYQIKLIRTAQWNEKGAFILGVHNTDEESRRDMERVHALQQARVDGLTGLLNRVIFEQDVDRYCGRATSKNTALVYFDMDTFKRTNDELGQGSGDRILEVTAESLRRAFPTNVLLGRMGGDEFAAFMPDAGNINMEPVLASLKERVRERLAEVFPGANITVSIGCVICCAENMNFNDLRVLAEREVYKSKLQGRNRMNIRTVSDMDRVE